MYMEKRGSGTELYFNRRRSSHKKEKAIANDKGKTDVLKVKRWAWSNSGKYWDTEAGENMTRPLLVGRWDHNPDCWESKGDEREKTESIDNTLNSL